MRGRDAESRCRTRVAGHLGIPPRPGPVEALPPRTAGAGRHAAEDGEREDPEGGPSKLARRRLVSGNRPCGKSSPRRLMAPPLAGIKVLDFTSLLPGLLATLILA